MAWKTLCLAILGLDASTSPFSNPPRFLVGLYDICLSSIRVRRIGLGRGALRVSRQCYVMNDWRSRRWPFVTGRWGGGRFSPVIRSLAPEAPATARRSVPRGEQGGERRRVRGELERVP